MTDTDREDIYESLCPERKTTILIVVTVSENAASAATEENRVRHASIMMVSEITIDENGDL